MAYAEAKLCSTFNNEKEEYTLGTLGDRMLHHLDQISLYFADQHNRKYQGLSINNVLDFHWVYWSLWMLLHLGLYMHLISEAK